MEEDKKKNQIKVAGMVIACTSLCSCNSEIEDGTTDIDSWPLPRIEVTYPTEFEHPGVVFTVEDIERFRKIATQQIQPQYAGYELLSADIQYGEFVRETTVKVTVVKRNETPQEREKSKLSELLQRAQEEDPESEKIQLPTEIEGRKISWEEDIPETGWKILAGALLLAAAVFFFQDKDLHDLVEKKKREERRSYPEILQKLTLYLEAGLTVRSAFCRVAEDYEKERKRGGRCREAYEEMLIATREIHMGVPEGAAYENFGKRTGVREYVRLSTFLTQNLKKGSSTLLQQLKEESVQAEELRIQNARKLSEEATTKLLLPMVMLLVVVMVMIMVPAFSNAGI